MASGQTQYYGLSQWEAVDKVERVDFNSDNAKIDGALRALAEQAGRKADKSTVTNLSSVVSQKADETALSAAEGRISALESGKADKTELAAQIRALSQSHDADTEALRSENCWVKLGTAALAAEQAEMIRLLRMPVMTGMLASASTFWKLVMSDLPGSIEKPFWISKWVRVELITST